MKAKSMKHMTYYIMITLFSLSTGAKVNYLKPRIVNPGIAPHRDVLSEYYAPCDYLRVKKAKSSSLFDYRDLSLTTIKPSTEKQSKAHIGSKKVIDEILKNLTKIVELKGEMTSFLEDNRETYGEYASLKEQKELLTNRVERLEVLRRQSTEETQNSIALISEDHSKWKIKKIINAINDNSARELRRIDHDLSPAKEQLRSVEESYFQIFSLWAPYKEYLNQLVSLEVNLEKSLKTLKKIEQAFDQDSRSSSGLSSTTNSSGLDFKPIVTKPFNEVDLCLSGVLNSKCCLRTP